MIRRLLYALFVISLLVSCKPSGPPLEPTDLMSYGVPIKINAPADVEIEVSDLSFIKDVTVKNEEGYSVQIFETDVKTLNPKTVLEELKAEISSGQFFSTLIQEDEFGFIFEKKIDESYTNYDFRHVKIRGDKQYVFQTGLSGQYTLDQVKTMLQSVL